MPTDSARSVAAAALRDLNHAFVARDPDDAQLLDIAATARVLAGALDAVPRRDRMALMRAATRDQRFPAAHTGSGFADRAVGGGDNPAAVDVDVLFDGDTVVARVVLRKMFEGAPGRAHGGIVAAAFDDVTGFVIGRIEQPAFTGELTVRYVAPVPIDEPLDMRAWLRDRDGRKLYIDGDARANGKVVATCRAIYITVDPSRFAGSPDPR